MFSTWIQTSERNRNKAKKLFADSPLAVVHKQGQDSMEPIAIGRIHVEKNPLKYRQYPSTAPSSPVLMPSTSATSSATPYIDEETEENNFRNENQRRKYFGQNESILLITFNNKIIVPLGSRHLMDHVDLNVN